MFKIETKIWRADPVSDIKDNSAFYEIESYTTRVKWNNLNIEVDIYVLFDINIDIFRFETDQII